MKKIILHLCADLGSDSKPYQDHSDYNVIFIGKKIGVENYHPPNNIYGIIANPPCTEFSTARSDGMARENTIGFTLVDHCMRIINEAKPRFWVLENPATGTLKNYIGKPTMVYQPWEFGSPWTKRTALWGTFNKPEKIHTKWDSVEKNNNLYVRPGRGKCSLAFLHKSAIQFIPEFHCFKDSVLCDSDFRSLCSQNFANQFFNANR